MAFSFFFLSTTEDGKNHDPSYSSCFCRCVKAPLCVWRVGVPPPAQTGMYHSNLSLWGLWVMMSNRLKGKEEKICIEDLEKESQNDTCGEEKWCQHSILSVTNVVSWGKRGRVCDTTSRKTQKMRGKDEDEEVGLKHPSRDELFQTHNILSRYTT